MRVTIDARLAGQRAGGIAVYTTELVSALAADAVDLHLTVLRARNAALLPVSPAISQRRTMTPAHHRWEDVAFGLEALMDRPDVLHSPDFVAPAVRRCPAVITVHDLAFLYWPEVLGDDGRRYYRRIHQAVATAEHVIAVSDSTRQDLINCLALKSDRITVVPEAAGAIFRPMAPAEREAAAAEARTAVADVALGRRGPYVLTVGTIEPRKNLPMLLRAFDRLARNWPDAPRLVLAGRPGWLVDETWQVLGRLEARDRVDWLEGPTTAELALLYTGALALAFPSRYEGFGLPALEAMAAGTPVLASDAPAFRELVDGAGRLLATDDEHVWTEALAEISRDAALRAHLAEAGRRRAASFSWAATARATMAVYRRTTSNA